MKTRKLRHVANQNFKKNNWKRYLFFYNICVQYIFWPNIVADSCLKFYSDSVWNVEHFNHLSNQCLTRLSDWKAMLTFWYWLSINLLLQRERIVQKNLHVCIILAKIIRLHISIKKPHIITKRFWQIVHNLHDSQFSEWIELLAFYFSWCFLNFIFSLISKWHSCIQIQ